LSSLLFNLPKPPNIGKPQCFATFLFFALHLLSSAFLFFYTSFGESSFTGHSGSVLPGGSKHQLCAKVHAVSSILCAPLDAFDAYALSASKPSALWSIHARELSDTGDDSFRTNLPMKQNMRPLASQEKQWWLRLAIKKIEK
jgi:hypothetical protein